MGRIGVRSWCWAVVSFLVATLVSPALPPAAARAAPAAVEEATAGSLEDACRALAERVLALIERDRKDKVVVVGAFSALPRLASSGGVGLAHRVSLALEAVGIAVRGSGGLQLSGEFRDALAATEFGGEGVALRVEYRLRDGDDRDLETGVINVFGDGPLEIAGGTADLRDRAAPAADAQPAGFADQQPLIRASFQRPQTFVAGNETRPGRDSPFGLEVRVAAGGVRGAAPRRPLIRDGRSFVALDKGDDYQVRLRNGTAAPVLVSLTIDGLDAFTFSEDPADKGRKVHFVIEPGRFFDVPGWYINDKRSDAFRITEYARSEAVKMGGSSPVVGQITATFYWAEAPGVTVAARDGEDGLGTERGDAVATDYGRANYREGPPLATITVRYDKAP